MRQIVVLVFILNPVFSFLPFFDYFILLRQGLIT